ncbi:MAG: SIMPL domain-containing protein [Chloroflexi bacterium]|nr:SIMPL domain-containing protein [Chloroflexota bacterium]
MLLVALLALALPAAAQDDVPAARTITVNGFGQAAGAPDIAYLYIGVDATNENPTEAFNQVNAQIDNVREAVMALGIGAEDIQTNTINLWVQDTFDPASGSPTGARTYRAQNMLTITVRDVQQVGEVITAAINAGANSINGLNFGIANVSTLSNEARLSAIYDARARAEQIAQALGATLGEVVRVEEVDTGGAIPQAAMYGMGGGAGDASVSEGQLAVSVKLIVTYAISAAGS